MKEIKMTKEMEMQKLIEKAENKEFSNAMELVIAMLNTINLDDENLSENHKKADTIRRNQIKKWLEKTSKAINENTLKDVVNLNEMLEKIDNKESLSVEEILPLVVQMFDATVMASVIHMLGTLAVDSGVSLVLNPEEDYFMTLIHGFDNTNVERTSLVLDLGKGNSKEIICDNFFKGFLALFLLSEIASFYELNLSLQAMKDNKVIENLVQDVLKNVK